MQRIPIFRGRIVDLGIETAEFPDGRTVELEMIRHPGAAAVVPLHEDGSVTLIQQFRLGGGGLGYEIPAGVLGEGEVPDLCAERELEEETGLRCARIERLGMIHTTPGFTDERIFLFLATGLTQGEARLEADEYIKPLRVPMREALAMIDAGTLTDAKTICALTMAERALARMG